ncbi:FAD binding domain-containing protein [Leekyejoonella antrihumi]|uniref:Xanthine dehydrogenase family protein subunit M n=1 Tax=Leekyejoonella antrihumi TaxID=1660198 RepID=A0A563DR46_9MICO|nr:FAD binding domain-containing protein [Leekyejoonella antrihumi]TWP32666.1 xanthine dehydrogenase family protein subunit M [Leekyejoonella antrihumi]
MKPPQFDYVVAASVEHAIELLEANEDAKVLAGGQSLIPLLSMRFASPTMLIDISHIAQLRAVRCSDEVLAIGALARHVEVEHDPVIHTAAPLLAAAATWVAHPQIRNRGTIGGAIAHSDAAAEFPAALLALDATIVTRSQAGERRIAAADFFGSHFQTALDHGELLVTLAIPVSDAHMRWGFYEFARRKGDYAIGGAAVSVRLDDDGRCTSARAGLISAGPGPTLAEGLDQELVGRWVDAAAVASAVARAASSIAPADDVHGTSRYRRAVVAESLRRALHQAFDLSTVHTGREAV